MKNNSFSPTGPIKKTRTIEKIFGIIIDKNKIKAKTSL